MSKREKKPVIQTADMPESEAAVVEQVIDLPEGLEASEVEQPLTASDVAETDEKADKPEKVKKAKKSEKAEKDDEDEKSEKADKGDGDKKSEKSEKAEKDDDEKSEKTEKDDEDEKSEKADKDDDDDKSEKAEKDDESSDSPAFDFDAAEEKMMALQHKLQEAKVPLVIVLEGWQAAGKGTIAGELLEGLDPRGYKVCVPERFSKDEDLYPPMHRYWVEMPRQGMITLFIGSWYHDLCAATVKAKHPKRCARHLEQISLMEQMLVQDGAIIEKFFLDIPAKVQKKRLKELDTSKATRGTLSKADWEQNRQYDRWQQVYQQVMEDTDQAGARWHVLNGEDKKACKQALYETIMACMEQAIAQRQNGDRSWDTEALIDHDLTPTEPIPELELFETDLPLELEYKVAVKEAQKKLHKLQYELYRKGIPMVIAFEGWDAAGKGGSIRRLTSALDPRGFTVVPIASPTPEEKQHHHMWRFWKALPQNGDIRIFDRTWYGRAMVERLEGFCTEAQWKRSYEEMNLFEKDLHEAGTILCKFWLQISPEEQLARFNKRATTPEKQWKITDEDWRNREKWDEYEVAINEMLKKTNTAYAPWTVVESDNKHYARIKVLHTVIAAIEKRLNED